MPKPGKGKGKGKKKGQKGGQSNPKREIEYAGDGQVYALVTKAFGGSRFDTQCYDGKTRNCKLRGKMINKRGVWNRVYVGDIVLVDLGVGKDDGGMISFKYLPHEIKQLKKDKEIPKKITKIEDVVDENQSGTLSGDDGDEWDGFINYI